MSNFLDCSGILRTRLAGDHDALFGQLDRFDFGVWMKPLDHSVEVASVADDGDLHFVGPIVVIDEADRRYARTLSSNGPDIGGVFLAVLSRLE